MITILLIIISFIIYVLIEYFIRSLSYSYLSIEKYTFPSRGFECWRDIVFLISPGYWFAKYYKRRVRNDIEKKYDFCNYKEYLENKLKEYIINNNHFNIVTSFMLFFLVLCFSKEKNQSDISHLTNYISIYSVFFWVVVWRLISRCFEITVAFGFDVMSENKPSSALNKYDRISLALKSYLEIYVISSTTYVFMPHAKNALDAIFISLGTGTLSSVSNYIKMPYEITNLCFSKNSIYLMDFFLFIQIFTTLSLVILSLAVYVGRSK